MVCGGLNGKWTKGIRWGGVPLIVAWINLCWGFDWGVCCFGGMRDIAVRGDTNLLTRAYPQQIVRQAYSHAYRTPSNTNRL